MAEQHYHPQTYRARDSVGYLVRRLYTVLLARFEGALAEADVTLTQWIVLIQVRDGFARTASDIANDLGHDSGALTRVLDQLERRGLLRRRRSVQDRRAVELTLTAAGKALIHELLPLVVDQTNAALAPLTQAEFGQMRGYLVRLLEHAQASPVAPPATPAKPRASRRAARGQPARKAATPPAPRKRAAKPR